MSNESCGCCASTDAQATEDGGPNGRWLGDGPVETEPLPPEMARIMRRFYGRESVDTLSEFVAATREGVDGGAISVEDLCHVAGETAHVATTAEETYYFRCFYDGVALAYLVGEPVEIRTESPGGTPIEVRASPDGDVETAPAGAAMSFGIASEATAAADGDPTVEDVYEAVCPSVKAFPSREEYENWAAETSAATVGVPLAAGVPIAAALTDERTE